MMGHEVDRIAKALERIANALEARNAQPKKKAAKRKTRGKK